jgi:N utilization substance protein A
VAVYSRERDVDPVGACVGMKGSRVQSIIRELRGEKIDIIEYSDDLVTFAQSALAPAKITRVSVTHQGDVPHLDVIVEDEQLSLAIGKRGQNVRLASELIGSRIDIKSESDVKDEVADALARMLHTALNQVPEAPEIDVTGAPGLSPALAQLILDAGLGSLDSLAEGGSEALLKLELDDLDVDTAESVAAWAQGLVTARDEQAAADLSAGMTSFRAPEARTSSMGDEDFMAALSRAFAESEQQRAQQSDGEEGEQGEGGGEGTRETE